MAKDKIRTTIKRWRKANAERIRQYKRQYRQLNADLVAAGEKANRIRRGTAKALSPACERQEIRRFYLESRTNGNILCGYCSCETRPGKRHVDHKTPLIRGGQHVLSNLIVSCPQCNLEKGVKTSEEFMQGRK